MIYTIHINDTNAIAVNKYTVRSQKELYITPDTKEQFRHTHSRTHVDMYKTT